MLSDLKKLNTSKIITPALLVIKPNIIHNIKKMIEISGDKDRLWPHIKTHKMSDIIKLQIKYGIKKFKCSTISELKLLSSIKKIDQILLAMQLTEDKIGSYIDIQKNNPEIIYSTLIDNFKTLDLYDKICKNLDSTLNVWIDINNGMNRTGIEPNKAIDLYNKIDQNKNINLKGFHVYDGNIRHKSEIIRKEVSDENFQPVISLLKTLNQKKSKKIDLIAGGSPTFLPHSYRKNVFLSPGTTLLWDYGYSKIWPESPFLFSGILATRVISKPKENLICFDLGHKAIAPEMKMPRAKIIGLENAKHLSQSEEHLVIESNKSAKINVGDIFYAVPNHICPTVAKYNSAYVINHFKVEEIWKISARNYNYEINF